MFTRIKRLLSNVFNGGEFQSQPKTQERPTGYEAPEISVKAAMKDFDKPEGLPQDCRATRERQVNKVFAGNSAFLKSRTNRPNPRFSSKMGSALVQVMSYDDYQMVLDDDYGSYELLLTITQKDGSVIEQVRKVGVEVYFDKIQRGFMSEITEQQYNDFHATMRRAFSAAVNTKNLNKFKADYEAHRAQQPNNQNVGVVVKIEENGVVSEKEYRGVDQIDAFIARAEKNEVRFLEMIR
jgi:hypothetical protein